MRVVIFCGGYGTRMWPVSRKSYPKQFYPLVGGKSFFEITFDRWRKIFKPPEIFVSTEKAHLHYIRKIAPSIPRENIITEPERRDNLGAIGLVCAVLEKRYPGEVMLVSWCDHFIKDEDTFLRAMKAAAKYAEETGLIVSVNEKPKTPSVHNEWVRTGEAIDEINGHQIVKILETVKRPNLEVAKRMFRSNGYLLNTGYRAWRTDIMLGYYKQFQPDIYMGLEKIMEGLNSKYSDTVTYREYHKFPKDSVEFGIFVNLPDDKSATIPSDFGWQDAGTWELFYKTLKKENAENVIEGDAVVKTIEASRNLIIGHKGKVVALIGVNDIAVIDTPNGLLVVSLEETSKVKDLFGVLEKENPEYT